MPHKAELLIRKREFLGIEGAIAPTEQTWVWNVEGLHVFPQFIDAHSHIGIAGNEQTHG